jgi:hypothetical protein
MKRRMAFAEQPPLIDRANRTVPLIVAAWTLLAACFTATVAASYRVFTWDSRVAALELADVKDDQRIIDLQKWMKDDPRISILQAQVADLIKQRDTEVERRVWLAEYLKGNPVGKH